MEGERNGGVTADGCAVSFQGQENMLELDGGGVRTILTLLKTTELYMLKGSILYYVNYISIMF